MITVLAEKPDVAVKIAAALGGIRTENSTIPFDRTASKKAEIRQLQNKNGYLETEFCGETCRVTWALGHLLRLKNAAEYNPGFRTWRKIPLPFLPETYEITPVSKAAKDRLKIIGTLFAKSSKIINATDFDREGEVIFSYIYEHLKCKVPVLRACYSSMTEEGFKKAFEKLLDRKNVLPMEEAGRMRAIADWAVGINLTVGMTVKNPGNGVLSIGRVQTPTLKILYDREMEIENFVPEPYSVLNGEFTNKGKETYRGRHEKERFLKKDELERELLYLEEHKDNARVADIEKTVVRRPVPHLYSLATLQMAAHAKYRMTLKQTLSSAQSLYTKGYTTYPRTTSQYLTEDMYGTVCGVLNSLKKLPEYAALIPEGAKPQGGRYFFDNTKVDSHFAIIPTGILPKGLTGFDAKIYDLIAKSVIRMLYPAAELEKTKVKTTVGESRFLSEGTRILNHGWMSVDGTEKESPLPDLKKDELVQAAFAVREEMTKSPERYTDRTILQAMITAGKFVDDEQLKKVLDDPSVNGIGTSATRDAILEGLIEHAYVERNQKKAFVVTEKGKELIRALIVETVKSPEMTARWEQRLFDIAHGKEEADVFLMDIEREISGWCEEIGKAKDGLIQPEKKILPCPKCQAALKEYAWGYKCEKQGCDFSIGTLCGKKLTKKEMEDLILNGKTGVLSGFKSKAGKNFRARLVFDEVSGKVTFEFPAYRKRS